MLPVRSPVPIARESPADCRLHWSLLPRPSRGGRRRAVYRPRKPKEGLLYRLLEDRFEEFAIVHEERFEREDGSLRPVVRQVVNEFLDCGIPENGFARVRCPRCRAEYFVPFSCQTRNFCASCAQKRALLFAVEPERRSLRRYGA